MTIGADEVLGAHCMSDPVRDDAQDMVADEVSKPSCDLSIGGGPRNTACPIWSDDITPPQRSAMSLEPDRQIWRKLWRNSEVAATQLPQRASTYLAHL